MNVTFEPDLNPAQLWQILLHEARATEQKEPFLAPVLKRTLLDRGSLQDAIAHRLAGDLASAGMGEGAYLTLLSDVLDEDPAIVADTALDFIAVYSNDPACRTHVHAFLNYKGFHALQVHRIAHRLWNTGRRELAVWLSNRASAVSGTDIHPAAKFGAGIMLDHGSGIVIGETAVVEDNVTILQNVTLGGTGKIQGDRHPKVRRGVMIGTGANIIGNIEIGAFSKVGAGSVVLKDVPQGCTVAGIPAQIVRLHPAAEFPAVGPVQPFHC
ncbi:serine O-acetyltransferase [Roseobacter sp. EG26]|uniref:serine O-acetyltransferase n=1 Tax=Roseobacter sp. EG26 TaxID=3412477 RepID=UPI003CE59030